MSIDLIRGRSVRRIASGARLASFSVTRFRPRGRWFTRYAVRDVSGRMCRGHFQGPCRYLGVVASYVKTAETQGRVQNLGRVGVEQAPVSRCAHHTSQNL